MGLDRDFLAMLTATVQREAYAGEDTWGNATYAAATPLACFLNEDVTTFGAVDGERQEGVTVVTGTFICDAGGAALRDKVTVAGAVGYVTQVETARAADGSPLYLTVTVESTEKG